MSNMLIWLDAVNFGSLGMQQLAQIESIFGQRGPAYKNLHLVKMNFRATFEVKWAALALLTLPLNENSVICPFAS